MKVTVLCICLLLATSQAVGVHRALTNAQTARIEKLQKTNTWGAAFLTMAELNI